MIQTEEGNTCELEKSLIIAVSTLIWTHSVSQKIGIERIDIILPYNCGNVVFVSDVLFQECAE